MSKKLVIATIGLLVFGGLMIPGGPLINNIISTMTYEKVDEGLLGIKEEAIPLIKESATDGGMPALLFALKTIKEQGMEFSEKLANATLFMGTLNLMLINIPIGMDDTFWNFVVDPYMGFNISGKSVENGFPAIKGISEWFGENLIFSLFDYLTAEDFLGWGGVNRLRFGVNATGWWGDRLPGIYEDTLDRVGWDEWPPEDNSDAIDLINKTLDRGFGLIQMLDLIEIADESQIADLCGPNGYNLTAPTELFEYNGNNYTKLELFYHYIKDWYNIEAIPLILPHLNDSTSTLSRSYPQYQASDWNGNDLSYEDLVLYSLIEQWAKCLSFDEGTDLHDAEPAIPVGTYGLEPGGPGVSSGIPMQAALQLWNETNTFSLLNLEGLNKWHDAYTDNDKYDELLAEFSKYPGYIHGVWNENLTYGEADWGFDENDMDLILDWLWGDGGGWGHGSFFEYMLPRITTDEIAFNILLEVWANGTVFGQPLYPYGYPIDLGFAIIHGLEVGYQGPNQLVLPTNITLESALLLWDLSGEFSLVSKSGIQRWFSAVDGDIEVRATLKIKNNLTEAQMEMLLDWIPHFQHDLMPFLAQYQMGLPTDSISLGNIIQIGSIGIGAACLGLGVIGVIGKVLARKKRYSPFEIGS